MILTMALIVDRFVLGAAQENCYVVRLDRGAPEAAVIDPGDGAAQLRLELAGMGARCAGILITHCHWDHLMGVADLAEGTGAPVYVPELERPVLEQPREFFPDIPLRPYEGATGVEGGETVSVAGIDFETVSIPGHSPGHLAYYADGCLFSGDLLFAGSVGRTDLPFSDWETLLASIQALFDRFPPETGRLSRARPRDDARRRAADESVPRRAPHRMIKAPRGTHDILPDEQPLFRHVTGTFAELAERYGYRAITTPTIEHVELIERTSGEGSDIIQKEIYTLVDRSERTLALRPEATAPVARAYLEHGMHREPQPVKTYLVGQMFRYDRPQRGRYREFWQLNVEAMGSEDPALDAEVIQLYDALLRRLGIRRYWLELNSIGDRECRPAYVEQAERVAGRPSRRSHTRGRAEARDQPAARVRREGRARPRGAGGRPEDRRVALRQLPRALRRRAPLPRRGGRGVSPLADPRPRSRLLHAHDLRVPGRGARGQGLDPRRRPLRLPDRADRRPADTGHRLGGRRRAPAPSDRRRRARPARSESPASTSSSPSRTARRASRSSG